MDRLDFALSNDMLTLEERGRFSHCLAEAGVDEAVWDVYAALLRASSDKTRPLVLRAHDDGALVGAAFVARCEACGKTLFGNPLLHVPFDLLGLPAFIWIRVGYCAETLANPGFAAADRDAGEVLSAMLSHLVRESYGVMVMDAANADGLHDGAPRYPYVSDGLVELAGFEAAKDYAAQHRNIKRKIKAFVNKGGTIEVARGPLDASLQGDVLRCIDATTAKSLIHSPFQDIFPKAVRETCASPSDRMVHFIGRMRGEFLGYHTFLETGDGLRMLHGAFDRTRRTTFHCYENLIIESVRWALERGLKHIHFGPIMNETKRRMMNASHKSRMYFHSDKLLTRTVMPLIFPYSRLLRKELRAFAE